VSFDGVVKEVVSNDHGIAVTFREWKERSGSEADRFGYYQSVIREGIAEIENRLGEELRGVPLVISGMASSSIGMMNLPYGRIPFALDGSDLVVHHEAATETFAHPLILISGIRSDNDVMRGEETQLVGVARALAPKGEHLFIFPGTHSKHIRVVDGKAVAFTTYMTGEFFEILSRKSILADSVSDGGDLHQSDNLKNFHEGVLEGAERNLLNSAFHVRTRSLLHNRDKEANYYFLSGLLIGTELAGIAGPVTIVGGEFISSCYQEALRVLGVLDASVTDGAQAVIRGQAHIVSSGITF
jgi:2-dehydro-3-deoxygalactonokinase